MACRRTLTAIVLTALAAALAGVAHADYLVVFHNGRTLRVQSIREEGDWSFLTLGKKSEMGVPAGLILSVAEIEGRGEDRLPNVQAAAGDGGGGSTQVARPRVAARGGEGGLITDGGPDPQDLAEQEALAAQARSDALARAAARARRGTLDRTARPVGDEGGGEQAPAGVDLTGGPGAWPSLLDRGGRRGRSQDAAPAGDATEESQDNSDDPER